MKPIHRWGYSMLLALLAAPLLSACTGNVRPTAPGESPQVAIEEARQEMRTVAADTLQTLYATQPAARGVVEKSAGYAVFSNFGMKILIAGGGTGEGLAVNNKTKQEIFMRMAEVQAGLGFGIKKFRLVWVFETQQAFDSFVNSGYQFGGQTALSAKAGGVGAGVTGAASVSPGVWVYQITDDGIAAELTVKGTKYYRDNELN
jgi:lipid-binding SYLF domain-containing protein